MKKPTQEIAERDWRGLKGEEYDLILHVRCLALPLKFGISNVKCRARSARRGPRAGASLP